MTIGTQLLHEAKAKLKAALTALRDELKNPDTAGEARDSVMNFFDEMDEHARSIGFENAMEEARPLGSLANEADHEPEPDGAPAPGATNDEQSGEKLPEPEAPAAHEGIMEHVKEELKEAVDAAGEAIGEAKFNT